MIRTILVPLATELPNEALLDAALIAAKRLDAHIRALFIQPDPGAAFAYVPDVILATGVSREVIEREMLEMAAAEKDHFTAWRNRNNLPEAGGVRVDSCFATWSEHSGEIEALAARFGRLSDLIVVQRPRPGSIHAQLCFDAAVFESGRPTLVVSDKSPLDMTDHVIIAWNGSLQASRAVLGAMPLLHLANRVSIFAAPQYDEEGVDPADLAESLSWHGVRAHRIVALTDGRSTGAARVGRGRAGSVADRHGCLHSQPAATEFSGRCNEASPRSLPDPLADDLLTSGRRLRLKDRFPIILIRHSRAGGNPGQATSTGSTRTRPHASCEGEPHQLGQAAGPHLVHHARPVKSRPCAG